MARKAVIKARRDGPFLSAAFFCEKVLTESDGVPSIIRIVDRVAINAPQEAPDAMPPIAVQLRAFIAFKSGGARGRHAVNIRCEPPSGGTFHVANLPVLFEGDERGTNLILDLGFQATEEGLYWFDVLLDSSPTILSRIPLRIMYMRATLGPSPGTTPKES